MGKNLYWWEYWGYHFQGNFRSCYRNVQYEWSFKIQSGNRFNGQLHSVLDISYSNSRITMKVRTDVFLVFFLSCRYTNPIPLSDTLFCDIVVNHEIIKRACMSQQRALEGDAPSSDQLLYNDRWCHPHLYISTFLGCVCRRPHFRAESVQASPFSPCAWCTTC